MNNELTAALLTIDKCRELSGCPAGVDLQDWVKQLAAENLALKVIVSEINNELYGQGFEVAGWHLNGALEPLDNWFTDNGWGEPETPATDRIVAEAEARGIEKGIAHLENKFSNIGVQIMNLQWLADSLREGADK
ncbi:hypothetical protein ABLV66_21280 [Klebsiella sp. CN_Kp073]|uniref:hypothetical protein n=1 Tax=Klebsiella sp. CN_Kp073 TaxID=3153412 RepID=UPI0032B571B3